MDRQDRPGATGSRQVGLEVPICGGVRWAAGLVGLRLTRGGGAAEHVPLAALEETPVRNHGHGAALGWALAIALCCLQLRWQTATATARLPCRQIEFVGMI